MLNVPGWPAIRQEPALRDAQRSAVWERLPAVSPAADLGKELPCGVLNNLKPLTCAPIPHILF
jgi:hypothetical protein